MRLWSEICMSPFPLSESIRAELLLPKLVFMLSRITLWATLFVSLVEKIVFKCCFDFILPWIVLRNILGRFILLLTMSLAPSSQAWDSPPLDIGFTTDELLEALSISLVPVSKFFSPSILSSES